MPKAAAVSLPDTSQSTGGVATQTPQFRKNVFKHRRHLGVERQEPSLLHSATDKRKRSSCWAPGRRCEPSPREQLRAITTSVPAQPSLGPALFSTHRCRSHRLGQTHVFHRNQLLWQWLFYLHIVLDHKYPLGPPSQVPCWEHCELLGCGFETQRVTKGASVEL